MTAEDRLRDLLRSEATTITPDGDGLARIRARVARRHRVRFWLLPSAAVATVAAAAAFVLIAPDDPKTQTLQPGGTPTATSEATASPTLAPPLPGDTYTGPAIWPFTSQAQAEGWTVASTPWDMRDSKAVTEHFVSDYLGLTGVTVTQTCVSCEVLGLDVAGRSVGEVTVAHYSVGAAHLFTVVGVAGTDLTITSPAAGAAVASPTSVTGRITGVDENVQLRLLTAAGTQLATAGAPAGSAVPWSATLTWSATDWSSGAVIGVTRSPRDGSVNRVVAVPVIRSTTSPTASFAALVDGHVALFDGSTGKQLRQLTYPPSGQVDGPLASSRGQLVWVRSARSGTCGGAIDQLDAGTPSTLITSSTVRYVGLALADDRSRVAWVEQPCDGSAQVLVVRGGGAPDRRVQVPATWSGSIEDVSDDGRLLLSGVAPNGSDPADLLLPVTARSLDDAITLGVDSSCLAGATAWDGAVPVALESCNGTLRLARFDTSGHRTGDVPVSTDAARPSSLAMSDGTALLQLDPLHGLGPVARFDGTRLTTLIGNDGCEPDPGAGCVSSPDW